MNHGKSKDMTFFAGKVKQRISEVVCGLQICVLGEEAYCHGRGQLPPTNLHPGKPKDIEYHQGEKYLRQAK